MPALDLTTRAHAWALLWGEQPEITQQWLALAHMLQQTSHAGELAAPLSLLVDHFGLPAENFLTQMALTASDTQSDVVVHPVKEGRLLNAVSLSLDSLALLTRELVLTVENSVLDNVDLLDIPVAPDSHPHPLWRAKLGWMLAHYRQQVQPDVLVICNALASRSQTSAAARHLLEWVNATQPQHESALPGVVWAITPQDARFATQQNLDEAVQQLMGKPGVHWGTLQALDKHSMQRLVEWLSQATSAPQRQARLQALREQLRGRVRDLLPMFDDAQLPVETVIRRLQARPPDMATCWPGCYRRYRTSKRCYAPDSREKNRSAVYLMTRSISLPTNQRALQRQKVMKQATRRTKCGSIICASGPTAGIMRSVWVWNRRCSTPWRRF